MEILMVSPLRYKVAKDTIGSIESVIAKIIEGLKPYKDVHITLLGTGDSMRTYKNLDVIEVSPNNYEADVSKYIKEVVSYVRENAYKYDLIHSHLPVDITRQMITDHKVPIIKTIHGAIIKQGDKEATKARLEDAKHIDYLVPVAKHLSKESTELHYTDVAYNPVDIEKFTYNQNPTGDYWMYLGRITPTKGPQYAVQAAHRCNKALILAGQIVTEKDRDFFYEQINPYLNDKIVYLGTIGDEKIDLLQNAKLVIAPSCVEEAFSLTATEAMACGTPVLATNRGGFPELIKEGYNGYLVDSYEDTLNIDQMCEKVLLAEQLPRINCRKTVEENFTIDKMAKSYLKIYYNISVSNLTKWE